MSDHHFHMLGVHGTAGLLAGVTGAAIADRLLTVVLGILSSLTILVATELLRPWLRRRTARLSADAPRPSPPDDSAA